MYSLVAVMTLLCTAARPGDPLREAGRELVLATDKDNNQVLFFQRAGVDNSDCTLGLSVQVELLFDLGDPGLAVCHPTVLALFSGNFDKQTLDDLTMEVLESDLVDSTIYLERLEGVPVARVASAHGGLIEDF